MAADGHRLADYIPQSTLHSKTYRLHVATYPPGRFIDPRALARDRRAPLPIPVPAAARADSDVPTGIRLVLVGGFAVCAVCLALAALLLF